MMLMTSIERSALRILSDKRGEECASNPVRGKHLEQLLRQEMSNSERAA
jgi:hypothetical protein